MFEQSSRSIAACFVDIFSSLAPSFSTYTRSTHPDSFFSSTSTSSAPCARTTGSITLTSRSRSTLAGEWLLTGDSVIIRWFG